MTGVICLAVSRHYIVLCRHSVPQNLLLDRHQFVRRVGAWTFPNGYRPLTSLEILRDLSQNSVQVGMITQLLSNKG